MELTNEKIGQILLENNYITEDDIKKAEEYARNQNSSVLQYLYKNELITPDLLGQAVAEASKLNYFDLNSKQPDRETVNLIPEDIARKLRIIITSVGAKKIIATTDSPENLNEIHNALIPLFPGMDMEIDYSLPQDIDNAFLNFRKPLETRFNQIIQSGQKVAPNIIDQIFEDALLLRASDIHFEPGEESVEVRFRVDGVLQIAGKLEKDLYENVLNRIKVLAKLRIDEHYATQDSAIRLKRDNYPVDLRVSIVPTLDGEKIVIRVLSEYLSELSYADLGLSESDQQKLERASRKPFGMILTAGPTGSGKTTTLYSIIRTLNKPQVNITTIEDPVEYKIPGINQIQVNEATDLTFSKGLRSIVRQDPDIILVGEIRDYETADIAVNAALTGHLLLTTFHANDAATTIPRMLEMGVEPFLLASTLELIVAQRLVRKICNNCRYSTELEKDKYKDLVPEIDNYFGKGKTTAYAGKGCAVCNGTGYNGRIAIYELLENSPQLQDLILTNPSGKQIWELATSLGAITMFENGIEKVKLGITTLDEVLRVANPPKLLKIKDKKLDGN